MSGSIAETLLDLFLILLAAKIGDEIFRRIHQPAIIGEILAGVVVGPAVLGWVEIGETVEVFAELGAVFLLFWVGVETKLDDLKAVGRTAGLVGVLGVVLPFIAGAALAASIGESTAVVVFTGAALVATSVGITSAVLSEFDLVTTPAGRTILGAAVVDDILAMLILGSQCLSWEWPSASRAEEERTTRASSCPSSSRSPSSGSSRSEVPSSCSEGQGF